MRKCYVYIRTNDDCLKKISQQFISCRRYANKNNYEVIGYYFDHNNGSHVGESMIDLLASCMVTSPGADVVVNSVERISRKFGIVKTVIDCLQESGSKLLIVNK